LNESDDLSHFSAAGRARMVDVSAKAESRRAAVATGLLRMRPATLERIRAGEIAKGNVLAVADVAAVMAAKQTAQMIPMCHHLPLAGVEVEFEEILASDAEGRVGIAVRTTVCCLGPTGVEMEALCAAAAALLTVYDMCKAIDRGMRIENLQLEEKSGGRTGLWRRAADAVRETPP
jgi:cyclic pyranopterin phosphate synthase